jgi:hypothetical protein
MTLGESFGTEARRLSPNKQLLTQTTQKQTAPELMKHKPKILSYGLSHVTALAASAAILSAVYPARAADKRPNIVMLMTDTACTSFTAARRDASRLVGSVAFW